ncbi:MAG: 3-dehydroquinate synthase [Saprospirales bacterium]|nr:MAG: 3-dehydroquinate synthase [Saprospirales bacterium]
MKNIRLPNYSIYLDDQWNNLRESIKDYSKIIILMDINSRIYCLEEFLILSEIKKYETIVIPDKDGNCCSDNKTTSDTNKIPNCMEQYKNLDTCQFIFDEFIRLGADRHSLLINLGGGVVCDMGGFCAATFMRGFDFIHFPTTLLSQVDGSVGGKLGVNFKGYKNLVGVFKDPIDIFIFDKFLESLPERELRSGFAEIIKHAMTLNYNLWDQITDMDKIDIKLLLPLIEKSIVLKKQIVQTDPFEKGKRKILNFGHTIGHGIETAYLKRQLRITHGEAVAAGMIMECYLSKLYYNHTEEWMEKILNEFRKFFPKIDLSDEIYNEVLENIKLDKKNIGREPLFTLLLEVGNVEYDLKVPIGSIKDAINFYRTDY